MRYDAVIIGAGPSGLAAAARLAHFGIKVCLLEGHSRPGGLNSWHFVKGREISTGLHAFTNWSADGRGGALGRLLRQLRIKYADLGLEPQGQSSIRFPSARLRFSNDIELIRHEVAAAFPDQIDCFDRFRALVRETDEAEPASRQTSARRVIEEYIADPLLAEMLLCPVMFYGNPGGVGDGLDAERDRPDMDWLLFCVVWKCIFESGFGHPAHGMRPLWEMLAKRIADDGGEVRLSSRVERLVVRGGRVVGARLTGGETVEGEAFFSSAGSVETDRLLDPAPATEKPVGSISIVEGISLLDRPAAVAGLTDTAIFYSFSDQLRFRRPEGLVEDSNGVVCASGNYHSPASRDNGVVKISQLANYRAWRGLEAQAYAFGKHETAAGMAVALGKLGIALAKARNGAGKYAAFDDVFTPRSIERFTSHAEGALYGSPVKSRTGGTSARNLFLIGADQGFHGIVGAMLSGVAMVNLHLLRNRRPPAGS